LPKTIDTLSQDIRDIIDEGFIPSEENLEVMAENIKDLLRTRFTDYKEKGEPKTLRMSNLGKGMRALYYDLKEENPPNQIYSAENRVRFLIGDLLEQLFIFFIKEAGHELSSEQLELEIDGVLGHPDGVVDGVPLDIKTASTYSYRDKFANGNLLLNPDSDSFGYVGQISAYAQALGAKQAAFLAIDKQHGDWCVLEVDEMDMINASDRIADVRHHLDNDELPERCYEPVTHKNGNIELNKNCFWCRHKHECHSDANDGQGIRTFQYSNKKVDFIHIEKLPKVDEVI